MVALLCKSVISGAASAELSVMFLFAAAVMDHESKRRKVDELLDAASTRLDPEDSELLSSATVRNALAARDLYRFKAIQRLTFEQVVNAGFTEGVAGALKTAFPDAGAAQAGAGAGSGAGGAAAGGYTTYTRIYQAEQESLRTSTFSAMLPHGSGANNLTPPRRLRVTVKPSGTENEALLPHLKAILQGAASQLGYRGQWAPGDGSVEKLTLTPTTGLPGVVVLDTHCSRFLSGLSPDMTLLPDGKDLHPFSVKSIIELAQVLDDAHRGKIIHYLRLLMEANPSRSHVFGLLIDTVTMELFAATREAGSLTMSHGTPEVLQQGWRHLLWFLAMDDSKAGCHVPMEVVGQGRFCPTGFLGSSKLARVFSGDWQPAVDAEVVKEQVCKVYTAAVPGDEELCTHAVAREVAALKAIAAAGSRNAGITLFPEWVTSAEPQGPIIMHPIGKPAAKLSARMLQQLVHGLWFLHATVQYVHADVEPKHILLLGNSDALLIDFSVSRPVGRTIPGIIYGGTVLFAANDVLAHMASGSNESLATQPHHDLVALVKTAAVLGDEMMENAVLDAQCRIQETRSPQQKAEIAEAFWRDNLTLGPWQLLVDDAHIAQTQAEYEALSDHLIESPALKSSGRHCARHQRRTSRRAVLFNIYRCKGCNQLQQQQQQHNPHKNDQGGGGSYTAYRCLSVLIFSHHT
ncbi:hypothetical protein JKP88DRAFT_330589 [Tribonema minus]|uniref:Protein kinase domain-containing protein n=1 Tax=Tribonema minus TaxID=303371 RepID=A0A835YQX0_9STRA|nr:hypothetical protein JKP88DRAFT_330589 [Tribonema minus]